MCDEGEYMMFLNFVHVLEFIGCRDFTSPGLEPI